MSDAYTYIEIRIRPKDKETDAYPVEAELDDGSHFRGKMRITKEDLLTAQLDPRAYGLKLFDALFSGKIGAAYAKVTGRAEAKTDGRVRVRLWIDDDAAELHAYIWERLHPRPEGQLVPLTTDAKTPFSRYTSLESAEPDPIVERPIRVFIAVSNPKDLKKKCLKPIDVEGEVRNLHLAFGDLQRLGLFQVKLLPGRTGVSATLIETLEGEGYEVVEGATSVDNVIRHLRGSHVFHLVGHGAFSRKEVQGESTTALYMEKTDGTVDRVGDNDLVPKITRLDPKPHLVFLAACESAKRESEVENPFVGLGPKLVEHGIPAVVAMQDQVEMVAARRLTKEFYHRLMEHGIVDRALNEARNLLLDSKQVGWATPVLFSRLKTGQLFEPPSGDARPVIERQAFEPETVLIPAGSFVMGSDQHPHEKPPHPLTLPAYRIGRYPVKVREYAEFIQRNEDHPPPSGWWDRKPPADDPDRLDHPVTNVSWRDAMAYCAWLSKETGRRYTLPSEAEWEKAASWVGSGELREDRDRKRLYPWGSEWLDGRCNAGGEGTAAVCAHRDGASAYGVEDLVGNVQQWTRSLWGDRTDKPDYGYRYNRADGREVIDPRDLTPAARLVVRGGSYKSAPDDLRCSARGNIVPYSKIPWRGFRVAILFEQEG